jgi:hypothetical protein
MICGKAGSIITEIMSIRPAAIGIIRCCLQSHSEFLLYGPKVISIPIFWITPILRMFEPEYPRVRCLPSLTSPAIPLRILPEAQLRRCSA